MTMAATRGAFANQIAHVMRQLDQIFSNTSVRPGEVETALNEIAKKAKELADSVDGKHE